MDNSLFSSWWAQRPAQVDWDEWLHERKRDPFVDNAIRGELLKKQPTEQALWRQWRALHMSDVSQQDGRASLLVGWPVLFLQDVIAADTSLLVSSLNSALEYALLPLECTAATWPSAVSVGYLHEVSAGQLSDWTHLGPISQRQGPCSFKAGASVWVARVTVQGGMDVAVSMLSRYSSKWSDVMRPVCMRTEELALESGMDVKILPATGLWNSASFSRFLLARYTKKQIEANYGSSAFARLTESGDLTYFNGDTAIVTLPFPEETAQDLRPFLP